MGHRMETIYMSESHITVVGWLSLPEFRRGAPTLPRASRVYKMIRLLCMEARLQTPSGSCLSTRRLLAQSSGIFVLIRQQDELGRAKMLFFRRR